MKPLLLALCFSLIAAEAQAISRYNSTSMSCAEVQARVRGEGAAILRYRSTRNPSLPLYGRYVSDRRYCNHNEVAETAFVPAADTKSCLVRECIIVDPDDFLIFRRHRR
ncbi:hypothetical protein [Mesorhizobium sp. WSM2239]|uniref:Uncharacterized protein n=2 Tax=unclassified Mesorhizobium TaxID=325217 RepID=A0AAU8DEQ8_9HYPH